MIDVPPWLDDALKKRFDQLTFLVEQQTWNKELQTGLKQYFNELHKELDAEQKDLFLSWEEKQDYILSKEMEWIYRQGIRDGFHVILSLIHSHPDSSKGVPFQLHEK